MSKFFDHQTRTLHHVISYAGAVKIPEKIVKECIKINEGGGPAFPLKLRRCNAIYDTSEIKQYVSTVDHRIHEGNFNLDMDNSNDDLVPIQSTKTY